ncbi:Agenet domain-containing protein/bromo-adjacent-like proteiny (BAH) domain-containing protein [Abeliophyllum distichum]|uniref:Agenet domain-containing protein/bromo-adjacent-like proteiny (BAH) domain-containing protein n=1 Tax=Abeliophyllum distichum TaxID=126358 RepID=A0ABD1RAT8_9LAMI
MVNPAALYTGWEEEVVSNEKGRREVHYYLKRSGGGGADLVVVGKEKRPRHMSYCYAIKDNKSLLSTLKCSSLLKLRSRREVIDWLNSIVPDVHRRPSNKQFDSFMESKDGHKLDFDIIKDVQMWKPGHKVEFLWLGSPWTCRKRRRHYQSFRRNGVKISVHDFVYVLAEEGKRLVAYLDDMYEESRGNKMVVVRWFHKIDEVGFVLPRNYNDREIFFSLCLQELSIECIDGLATVLSPEHYEKFFNVATDMKSEPFVCCRLFDNDDKKPFDITRVKGYWKQKILRNISSPSLETFGDDMKVEGTLSDAVGSRPKKRLRWSKDSEIYMQPADIRESTDASLQNRCGGFLGFEGGRVTVRLEDGRSSVSMSGQDAVLPTCMQSLTIGSQVEVLSQDSGIRGCWYRALIIKKHKDKVKVKYQDIKDAEDDAKNLEEWVLASRLAVVPDELGIRICGRTIIRPIPLSHRGRVPNAVNVGSIVDALWHDGWWEGIVVKKESEDKLHVYFPGEKKEQIFSSGDLRHSQEWYENGWKFFKERPEVVSVLSSQKAKQGMEKSLDFNLVAAHENREPAGIICNNALPVKIVVGCGDSMAGIEDKKPKELKVVRDLTKDLLGQLRWKSSGKRRCSRSPVHKVHFGANSSDSGIQAFDRFFTNSSLKVDPDNCKYASDSLHTSSVVSSFPSLVMSR